MRVREMTVGRLHGLLEKLIEHGHGRTIVRVDKPTFTHPLEDDGAVILGIRRVDVQVVPNIGDDGGIKTLANGRESVSPTVVLSGLSERCSRCGCVECTTEHKEPPHAP